MNQIEDDYVANYLGNLLSGNRHECSVIAHRFLNTNTVSDLYEKVLKVALYQVGLLWEFNKISVATEHMATAITEGILNELFEKLIAEKRVTKKVVLTCVGNEEHQVGVKMVADVFEMNGWESYFLGIKIPLNELIRTISEIKPDILAISMSIYFNYSTLIKMLEKFTNEFPELTIIVGGQGFEHVKTIEYNHDKIIYLKDLYILDQFIKTINNKSYE